ncbi:MAG TPA: hypothetical protein DCS43_10695 [Verrucomicrobia bacterium]|nr:hypothetical protein [Verrucomicrobiota bacterium]
MRLYDARILVLLLALAQAAAGQTADYSLEEVEQRESSTGVDTGGRSDMAPAVMPGGAASIGSARSGVRARGGQSTMLRYDQHREIQPPEYATIRLGPFFSTVGIAQSIGYSYTRLSGAGIDYLEGNRRGDVLDDGMEFPMVSSMTLNNYLMITRKLDLEINLGVNYRYFPMQTQEDELQIDLTDEGIFATFSSQFNPSRDSRILVYDDILYRTDYVDTRGFTDRYGGREYSSLQNTVGMDWDWKPSLIDSFSSAASRRDTIPFDDEFKAQQGATYAEMLSYRRSFTPFIAGGLLSTASQSFYTESERADIFIYGLSAFTGLRLARRLTADTSLGYQLSTSSGGSGADSDSSSMQASLGLNHEISDAYGQRLSFQRSLQESFVGGVDISDTIGYTLSWNRGLFPGGLSSTYSSQEPQDDNRNPYSDWTTSLNLQHQLTRLLRLTLNTTYAMRMNDEAVDDTLPADLISDYETLTVSLSTGVRLTRNTLLSLYASHADRTSDNPDMVYTRDTVGALLTWSHQF